MLADPHQNAGDTIWLSIARKEVGTREGRGDKRIVAYHQSTGLKAQSSAVPWCAAFVCWCLEQAGVRSTRKATAVSYATYGRECGLEPGCIVVFGKHDEDAAGTGHVAFLVGVDVDTVQVLGGNQGNKVCVAARPRSSIVATRWPVV